MTSRQPLPPLSARASRIRLLAWSYREAAESPSGDNGEAVTAGAAGSRAPERNEDLWRRGSYAALERAMDMLSPGQRRAFWTDHVCADRPFPRPGEKREFKSFVAVAMLMPREIFVPADVAEAAGFLPSEAKTYERPRRGL